MMAVTSDLGSPILLRIISKERTEQYIAQFVLSLETQIFSVKQLFLKTFKKYYFLLLTVSKSIEVSDMEEMEVSSTSKTSKLTSSLSYL